MENYVLAGNNSRCGTYGRHASGSGKSSLARQSTAVLKKQFVVASVVIDDGLILCWRVVHIPVT